MRSYLKTIALIFILALTYNCSSDSEDANNKLPTLNTKLVFNITTVSATCGAEISSDGGSEITSKGLVYSTNPNPTLDDSVIAVGLGNGNFYFTLNDLLPGTFYYIKSYATNNNGTAYGQQETFKTLSVGVAILNTLSVESITNSSAKINGEIVHNGNSTITSKGIVWSTNPNPTISDNKAEDLTNSNTFSLELNSLNRNTTYYARAFATNAYGTGYGQQVTFITLNNYLMFNEPVYIYKDILQNKQDKILYLFTYEYPASNPVNFKLVAYDYRNKTVIQQKSLTPFVISQNPINSISSYNNQMELYIISPNGISILDALTLQIIETINLPSASSIKNVQQKNGLIFISYFNSSNSKIAVYNRNTLNLVSDTVISSGQSVIAVYKDVANPNQIKCLTTTDQSNYNNVLIFDNNGNYLSTNSGGPDYSEGNLSKTRDDVGFIIKGSRGRIYLKNNLSNSSTTLSSVTDGLMDYAISDDGSYIYSIQRYDFNNQFKILKYNTTNFTAASYIAIKERNPENIFVDGNNLLIVDYDYSASAPKGVFLTIY